MFAPARLHDSDLTTHCSIDGIECTDAALGDLRILNSLRATILSIRFFIRGSEACRRGKTKTSSFIPPSTFYSQ